MRYRVLSPVTIAVWAILIVGVGIGTAVWLLVAYTGGDTKTNQLQLDAIRTAGTIIVGTGGAAALLLAARRQRSAEIALRQTDREQVTDLYTKAADQLGSDKAPVRLAGLYALERLAQDNPGQRQTIVNVWCAYLRMPFDVADHREQVQEREVRNTAQRLLGAHARPGLGGPDSPVDTYWPGLELDLTGAALDEPDFTGCRVNTLSLANARVSGRAKFGRAKVLGSADFVGAEFGGDVGFAVATFVGDGNFIGARFGGDVDFAGVNFGSDVYFNKTNFDLGARFVGAEFRGVVDFDSARFGHEVEFGNADFGLDVIFAGVRFGGAVDFTGAEFGGAVNFTRATFAVEVGFDGAKFRGGVTFTKAEFSDDVSFIGARFSRTAVTHRTTFVNGIPPELA